MARRSSPCTSTTKRDEEIGGQAPIHESTLSIEQVRAIKIRDAPHQIDVLSRLPNVISGAANEADLHVRLVNMLRAGIRRADAVALVELNIEDESSIAEVLYWDRRFSAGGDFRPSQRLIREALAKQKQTVVHAWNSLGDNNAAYTAGANFDWAFCTPILGAKSHTTWGIYVAGQFSGDPSATLNSPWATSELGDDLKFAELVAAVLGSLRHVRQLQQRQASLSQFFSPAVMEKLANEDPAEVLRPRESDVTVLFCDLRGFSKESEKQSDDLLALLERVSKALKGMTENILAQGGVIGDFHGDAAMGFWGWPVAQPDASVRACSAALGIRALFEAGANRSDYALSGFRVGIGMTTGRAVAGSIGTSDQVKVTVFGPVVNLASRLEGMTKILGASILMDERTAEEVKAHLPAEVGRCRRLARVKPYGMNNPLTVYELLPPESEFPELTADHIAFYEQAVDCFIAGKWDEAIDLLYKVPPADRVKDFLTGYIALRHRTPPTDWNGVIVMESKS